MADADEDEIPTSSALSSNPDADEADDDVEDGTQDYRLLNTLTTSRTTPSTLPKRGTKDFEPNPTRVQSSALHASREAMHNALSAIRVHPGGKSHNVGIYVGERERAREKRFRVHFDGEEEDSRCVVICRWRSTHAKAIGRSDRRGWTWLTPEEALYLLERGSLDIRWGDVQEDGEEGDVPLEGDPAHQHEENPENEEQVEPDPEPGELPMSLQGAYATFIGTSGLTLERCLVYAGLKRAGYIVQRAPTWSDEQDGQANGHTPSERDLDTASTSSTSLLPTSSHPSTTSTSPTLAHRLLSWLINPHRQPSCPTLGPLLAPGLYRNYNDVFRALSLIPYHQYLPPSSSLHPSDIPPQTQGRPKAPFTIAYHVWKPTPAFRKSSPPPPTYQLCVVDARSTNVPTASQIGDLLDSMPFSPLENEKEKRIEMRVKHGKRSVVVAVVDTGVVSYLRFAESESGGGKLFEDKVARSKGGKRGGGWGSSGRGGRRGGKR